METMEIVTIVLGLAGGILGVPIVQAIKSAFQFEDKTALLVSVLTSLIIAVGVAFASGQFTGMEVTLENLSTALTTVFSTATIIYKLFLADPKEKKPQS